MSYHRGINNHIRIRRARKTIHLVIVILFFLLLALTYAGVDWLINRSKSNDVTPSDISSTFIRPSTTKLFRTEYFQFQTDNSWSKIPSVSTSTKFVYRSYNGPLVEHQLVVFVNEALPSNFSATRVLPVEVIKGVFKKVAGVSEHCNNAIPKDKWSGPEVVTYRQVTFKCNVDSNEYTVFVGVIGGKWKNRKICISLR